MNIAFYAPMKSPYSPRPSGDRRIANLFLAALHSAGFEPAVASEFRSWEGAGDQQAQQRIESEGRSVANDLVENYRKLSPKEQPRAWFTYHLYHKAPDWIGPAVCNALGIPYFAAEASVSPRQADGQWQRGYAASVTAIQQAACIFSINPTDLAGLERCIGDNHKLVSVLPFLDQPVIADQQERSRTQRDTLADQYKLDPDKYWLLTVAMMRQDTKLRSYETLAAAVDKIQRKDWQLIVVGDGPAETLVREYFHNDFDHRVHFIGRKDSQRISRLMQSADLFVWPAINEALGMVALESLANGLPAVCGRAGGIDQIITHQQTGLLIDAPDQPDTPVRFAEAIESLLDDPAKLSRLRRASLQKYASQHQLMIAADRLATGMRPFIQ